MIDSPSDSREYYAGDLADCQATCRSYPGMFHYPLLRHCHPWGNNNKKYCLVLKIYYRRTANKKSWLQKSARIRKVSPFVIGLDPARILKSKSQQVNVQQESLYKNPLTLVKSVNQVLTRQESLRVIVNKLKYNTNQQGLVLQSSR